MVRHRDALAALLVVVGSGGLALSQSGETSPMPDPEAVSAVREALSGRGFPWYDATLDDFRAVTPPPRPDPSPPRPARRAPWAGLADLSIEDLGRLIVFVLLAAGLTALLLFVARSWRRRIEAQDRAATPKPGQMTGEAARVGTLPAELAIDESDPMEAARLLRARGDRSRAVVLLFAHQLRSLDRLGLIRLTPGRTGRQLVRSIDDEAIRAAVSRTLLLFEGVYYGHRAPDPDAFDALWLEAEALERRLAAGVAP